METEQRNETWVIDIESNALLADTLDYSSFPYKLLPDSKLWCIVLRNTKTDEVITLDGDNLTKENLKQHLSKCAFLVGHNVIKFDFLVLKLFGLLDYEVGYPGKPDKLFGEDVTLVDTLILSRLLNPDRFGGHSLHAWGERFKSNAKTDYRQLCIQLGYIEKGSPKGEEFRFYKPEMLSYCIQDTNVNRDVFQTLLKEMNGYKGWALAIKVENKLADLAIRRELFGFWFDKDLAIKCVEDLTQKMQELSDRVNPILPPKLMNKGELDKFTPPKVQFTKNGDFSAALIRFADRTGAELSSNENDETFITYDGITYPLPYHKPLKTHTTADISDLDHVKMHLVGLGWEPTEWAERDLTKDSKKISLPYEKRVAALERWYSDTVEKGKYKKQRLKIVGLSADKILESLKRRLEEDRPVVVPTSPKVRVGVEKDLCPNLTSLGEKVSFANDFALFLTYKHRKSCIAGGDIEDMDFDAEIPNTGYLSMYREVDGRIPTPAIEIGASTNRYRHIGVANVARATSIYGKEMRSMFGSGKDGVQFGYDFSSLEARIQGHYCYKYTGGPELAKTLLAEKPSDIHSVTGLKLGLPRSDAKSVNYMLIYGGQIPKVMKMLGVSKERATKIYEDFWDSMPALKELKKNIEKHWISNDKKFIIGIDGRKIHIRSQHSILNAAFQSAGVISAKYVTVLSMQYLEEQGHNIDPFKDKPDICSMIEYHDEAQLFLKKGLVSFKMFDTEEEAKEFVASWDSTNGQLSSITKGNEKWYITMPNDISKAIEQAISKTEKILKLNVNLGYEWVVNKTWYGCH